MGVSGCGKSTLAQALADALGLHMVDGDDLHPSANVLKMRQGTPLRDEDRWPWLARIGQTLAQAPAPGMVLACSALKRAYRDRIRTEAGGVRFVFLHGDEALLRARLQARQGHYMPASLLDSQLATLEPPGADEPDVLAVDLALPTEGQCAAALRGLLGPA
jgi:carbohydrate kinase (thermoresistant glucokinase family)